MKLIAKIAGTCDGLILDFIGLIRRRDSQRGVPLRLPRSFSTCYARTTGVATDPANSNPKDPTPIIRETKFGTGHGSKPRATRRFL